MEEDRPASPEQHLWSSILDSVSSSRAIPSKNVIILGEPSSGKSTIANALLQKSSVDKQRELATKQGDRSAYDFAVGYEWADVKDEAEEDTLARLSVFTVPSSNPAHLALLPHFVPPKTALPHSAIVIVLDWTRPWTFVEQLYTWLAWVEKWTSESDRELQVLKEEGRERLQSHLQHYAEPASNAEPLPLPGGTSLSSTLLPLSQGVFTHNSSGVPIIVVCAKADMIDQNQAGPGMGLSLLKAKGGEWEERTDTIMQILRTICLKYGASLFYTSMSQPVSLTQLRAYTLHVLFMPPAPPPDTPPLKYLFPFRQRPNLLDRDRIAVPSGWDSWGKVGVVREGFDCSRWSEAWENDLENDGSNGGAKALYRTVVEAEDTDKASMLPALITTEPEQTFLAKHYETLSKDPGRDPRATFRQPANPGEHSMAGVVGPMGSSSFNLPAVEKALIQMEGEDVGSKLARLGSTTTARRDTRATNLLPNQPNGIPAGAGARQALATQLGLVPGGPNSPATPLPGSTGFGGKSQQEILKGFFDDLLKRSAGASSAPGPSAAPASNTATATTTSVAASASQPRQPAATSAESDADGDEAEDS
ncbi:hypothetical protein FRC04_004002 [Tulasnella sp. 424]|nr:hypothetical protein FRC04_004002 [Tulasnella sp. 424]KAG8970599.1 hypothetical protein FRC05_000535 [Tulasnella sp. 425]